MAGHLGVDPALLEMLDGVNQDGSDEQRRIADVAELVDEAGDFGPAESCGRGKIWGTFLGFYYFYLFLLWLESCG